MSNWNAPGYAESPAAIYVQSLSEGELLAMIKNINGKTYNLAHYPGNKKGGLIGALNRIAIRHLVELTNQSESEAAAPHVGRTAKLQSWLSNWSRS